MSGKEGKEKDTLRKQIENMKKENASLKKQVDVNRKKNVGLMSKNGATAATIKKQENYIQTLKAQTETQKILQMRSEYSQKKTNIELLATEAGVLKNKIAQKNEEIKKLQAIQSKEKTQRVTEEQNIIGKESKKLELFTKELKVKNSFVSQCNDIVTRLAKVLGKSEEYNIQDVSDVKIEAVERELDQREEEIDGLKKSLQQVHELSVKIPELENQAKKSEETENQLANENKALSAEVSTLESQILIVNAKKDELNAQINSVKSDIVRLNDDISALENPENKPGEDFLSEDEIMDVEKCVSEVISQLKTIGFEVTGNNLMDKVINIIKLTDSMRYEQKEISSFKEISAEYSAEINTSTQLKMEYSSIKSDADMYTNMVKRAESPASCPRMEYEYAHSLIVMNKQFERRIELLRHFYEM